MQTYTFVKTPVGVPSDTLWQNQRPVYCLFIGCKYHEETFPPIKSHVCVSVSQWRVCCDSDVTGSPAGVDVVSSLSCHPRVIVNGCVGVALLFGAPTLNNQSIEPNKEIKIRRSMAFLDLNKYISDINWNYETC